MQVSIRCDPQTPMIISLVAHNRSRTEQKIYNQHYALIRRNNEITNVINLYVTRAHNSRLYVATLVFHALYCIYYVYNTLRSYENTGVQRADNILEFSIRKNPFCIIYTRHPNYYHRSGFHFNPPPTHFMFQ